MTIPEIVGFIMSAYGIGLASGLFLGAFASLVRGLKHD